MSQSADQRPRDRMAPWPLIAYAGPALPLAALTLPVYIHLPTYYASSLGLGLGLVGTLLLVARLWDMVTDPLVGVLSDRLGGRFGRRKPLILAGLPVTVLAAWLLLNPGEQAGAAHLLIWSLVLYTGWTMMILPLNALGAELSTDYHERSRIAAIREGFIVLGTLLALSLPLAVGALTERVDGSQPGDALMMVALFVVVLLPVTTLAMLRATPEPRFPKPMAPLSLTAGVRIMANNGPFRRLIVAYLINGIANGLPATLFLLFVGNVLQAEDQAGPLLFVYFLCGVAAVPVWLRLSRRFGKHLVWCGAMVWACAWFAVVPLLGAGDVGWFLLVCVMTGLSLGADLVLPSAMQADVVDLDRLESGEQRTGLYFAIWGMVTKLALALAVGIAFPILDGAGFVDGADNTPQALLVLALLYALLPVILKAAAIVLMRRYPITASVQEDVRRRIDEASAPATASGSAAHQATQ